MRGVRFVAEPLARSWLDPVDCRELAKLCQGAGLTQIQAEVVRLTTARRTTLEIAEALGLTEYKARGVAAQAEWRIRRSQSWIVHELLRDLKAMLECHRNTFHPKPQAPIIRKVPGGYDTVRLRAKPLLAHDLLDEEGRLLRSLPHLLEGRTMEEGQALDGRR